MEILSKIFLHIEQASKNFSKNISNITTGVFSNKRFFVLILLFFVLSGIILPQITLAWNLLDGVANVLIFLAMGSALAVAALFAGISGTLLTWATGIAFSVAYTKDNIAVTVGWPIIRDLANMFIVLGFVVIAVATILRFNEYEAKKLLPKLIGVALLINFSLVFCGIAIDGSNIVAKFFIDKAGTGIVDKITGIYNNSKGFAEVALNENPIAFTVRLSAMVMFYIISACVTGLYALLFLMRIVMLWILVIFSPLAFVCSVFPFTIKFWRMWRDNFFQWCIIGLPAGLFLYIASKMMVDSSSIPISVFTDKNMGWALFNEAMIKNLGEMFALIMPALLLVGGFLFSLKTSAMGADIITSRAKRAAISGAMGMLGVAAKTSGKAGNLLGKVAKSSYLAPGSNNPLNWLKTAGRGAVKTAAGGSNMIANYKTTSAKTRSAFGLILEGAGAVEVGTQAAKDDKNLANAIAGLTRALKSGNKKDEQRVFNKINNGVGTERVAAIQAAVSEGKLHEAFRDPATGNIKYKEMHEAITDAEKSAGKLNTRKQAEDKYYQLTGFGDKNVDAALTSLGYKGQIDEELGAKANTASAAERMEAAKRLQTAGTIPAGIIGRAQEKANYTKLTKNWSGMDMETKANVDLAGLDSGDLNEFALNRSAEDIKAFTLLDKAHDNRDIRTVESSASKMLLAINIELNPARVPPLSKRKKERLEEVRDELRKL